MTTADLHRVTHSASLGDKESMRELKAMFPHREFRRFWCDLRGHVVKWRAKGSKAEWKRL